MIDVLFLHNWYLKVPYGFMQSFALAGCICLFLQKMTSSARLVIPLFHLWFSCH